MRRSSQNLPTLPAPSTCPCAAFRTRKLQFIDESWDLLTNGDVAKFIEAGYRRFRKCNGAVITVTQSTTASITTPPGAIADSSAHALLLAQPSQAIDELHAENRLSLSAGGVELLKPVHIVPGPYPEIVTLTDRGAGIGRLKVDTFRRLLYATRPDDVAAIRKLRQEGHSVRDAINQLQWNQSDG